MRFLEGIDQERLAHVSVEDRLVLDLIERELSIWDGLKPRLAGLLELGAIHNQPKVMMIPAQEFIRRFLLHTLPPGFQRIRHCGLLANRHRRDKLALCRQRLSTPVADLLPKPADARDLLEALTGESNRMCPHCGAPLH